MALFQFTPSESLAVLRALKSVAMADGKFAVKEQAMLASSADLLGVEADLEALAPIEPGDLAAAVEETRSRVVALKACLVMGIVDGQVSPEEWKVLSAFRTALGIDEAELHTFHDLVNEHRQLTRFDFQRKVAAQPRGTMFAAEGWQGVMQFFAEDSPSGLIAVAALAKENAELAGRYRQLATMPEGSLGRTLHRHYREREFAFAGESGAVVPEPLVHHDIVHILSGYEFDFAGELQTLAFVAGMRKEDPFSALFLVLLQHTAGAKVTPRGEASPRALFDPDRVLRALERGRQVEVDFASQHDFWDVMEEPVADLRARYGVPPLA